jgi:predicted RNA-binding protein YlqC (UPF0109 family)
MLPSTHFNRTNPDEETKGRIIGKDGRNIRIFEKFLVVMSMDDSPDEVKL